MPTAQNAQNTCECRPSPKRRRRRRPILKTPPQAARRSRKLDDGVTAKINFFVFYELDNEEVGTVLRTDEYGGDDDYSWYLLEGAGEGEGEAAAAAAVAAGATSEM